MNRSTATRLSVFIQDQLKKKGWTGVDLGLMLGCDSKSTVSKIVNGKQAPSLNQMALLAESFDVSVAKQQYIIKCANSKLVIMTG